MKRGFICAKSSEFVQNFINKTIDISSFENIKKTIESIEDCSINITDIVFYDNIIDVQRTTKVSSYGFQSFDKNSEIYVLIKQFIHYYIRLRILYLIMILICQLVFSHYIQIKHIEL